MKGFAWPIKHKAINTSWWNLVCNCVPWHVEIARTCSKLVADLFEAKFHYALWFEAGSKLVAEMFEASRGPASSCEFAASKLDDRPNFSSLQVCDQLRTTFEPVCDQLRTRYRNGIWPLLVTRNAPANMLNTPILVRCVARRMETYQIPVKMLSPRQLTVKLKPNLASSGPDGLPHYCLDAYVLVSRNHYQWCLTHFSPYIRFHVMNGLKRLLRQYLRVVVPACDVANYRPISLTCVACKLMERVVATRVNDYLRMHQ